MDGHAANQRPAPGQIIASHASSFSKRNRFYVKGEAIGATRDTLLLTSRSFFLSRKSCWLTRMFFFPG
jgi:hypothetical protein